MNVLQTFFYVLMASWFLTEIYYKQALVSGKKDKKGKDKSTLDLLWIVILLSITSAMFAKNMIREIISESIWINYLGIFLLILGIFGRLIIIRSLGKYFTVDVTIKEDHQIKKDGFYSVLRHPSYTASLLTFLGLGLYLNNWTALAVAFIPPFLAFLYRIKIEEEALTEQFGQDYTDYKNQTKKLIPFIY